MIYQWFYFLALTSTYDASNKKWLGSKGSVHYNMENFSRREEYCKAKCSGILKHHGAQYIEPPPNELPGCTRARQLKIYKSINKAKARKRRAEATQDQKDAIKAKNRERTQKR